MRRWLMRQAQAALALGAACVALVATQSAVAAAPTISAQTLTRDAQAMQQWTSDENWFQELTYVFASGELAIQQQAAAVGKQAKLTSAQTTQVSAAVRAAWKRLMQLDPASVGSATTQPNLSGQRTVLDGLRSALKQIAGSHYNALMAATDQAYILMSNPTWLRQHAITTRKLPAGYKLVWATSFAIPNTSNAARYVALPDAYLKFANLGWNSSIPSLYQPYYLPLTKSGRSRPPYTVDIASPSGQIAASNVIISDVGPWSEDDNWWDPTYTGAAPPSGCPVSATRVSKTALTNPAVNGICPGTSNWRRTYYYLLYRHVALPFFQASAYQPTGVYRDTTAWPPALQSGCSEAAQASINDDRATCAVSNYNGHSSTWLRGDSYNAPVLNQASIDLSPGMDAALGWVYPSSGFVLVNVSRLP